MKGPFEHLGGRSRLGGLVIVLFALVLFAASCGNDDGGSDAGAPAAEETANGGSAGKGGKSEFLVAVNSACAERMREMRASIKPFLESADGNRETLLTELVDEVLLPGFEAEVADVRAQTPPQGDEKEVEAILVSMEEALDEARSDPVAFMNQTTPFVVAERLADRYGLTKCARL